jgi:hypothetical protein
MFCPYCGKQIADHSVLCQYCGQDIQPNNFNEINQNAGGQNAGAGNNRSTVHHTDKKKKNGKILIPVFLLIVIAAVVGGILFKTGILGGSSEEYCVWVSDRGYDFTRDATKKEPKSITLSGISTSGVHLAYRSDLAQFSPDGKYLYFINRFTDYDIGTLYRADLSRIKNSGDTDRYITQIDTDITTDYFQAFDDGTACFAKYDSSDDTYQLYYYDGKEANSIAKNIGTIAYFDKEVLFSKTQDDENASVYYKDLDTDEDPKKIITDACNWEAADTDHIIYGKNYNDDKDTRSLYLVGKNTDPVKIADDVSFYSSIEKADVTAIYYEILNEQEINLGDAVTYSQYKEDRSLQEPDPNDSKYREPSYFGTVLSDAYYEQQDVYYEAQDRLSRLDYLKSIAYNLKIYSLYSFNLNTGENNKIAGNVGNEYYTSTSGNVTGLAYYKGVSELKAVDISEYIEEYDDDTLEEKVSSAVDQACINRDKIYFMTNLGTEQELDVSFLGHTSFNFGFISFEIFDSGKKAAWMEYTYDDAGNISTSDIYVADINNDKIGSFSTLTLSGCNYINKIGDKLYGGDDHDLYLLVNGEFVLFREDTEDYDATWYTDGSILYLDDYQENYGGTLMQFDQNGKKSKIADDVTCFAQLESGDILYVTNECLKRYNGKETSTVSTSVDIFWIPNEKETIDSIYEWEYED